MDDERESDERLRDERVPRPIGRHGNEPDDADARPSPLSGHELGADVIPAPHPNESTIVPNGSGNLRSGRDADTPPRPPDRPR
jgi:hypothetical protein